VVNFILDALRSRRNRREEARSNEWIKQVRVDSTERLFSENIDVLRVTFNYILDAPTDRFPVSASHPLHLGEIGLNAFVQSYYIELVSADDLMEIVQTGREAIDTRHFVSLRNSRVVAHTYVASEHVFGGVRVHVLSNEVSLFASLNAAKFSPPPPWVAFPNFEPPSVLLQGEQQFWFEGVWDAFFQPLTQEERAAYLAAHDAPAEWVEDLNDRAMLPTDDPG
jgi:hypothetical protein